MEMKQVFYSPLRRNLGREKVLFFELVRTKGRETKENRSANSGEKGLTALDRLD